MSAHASRARCRRASGRTACHRRGGRLDLGLERLKRLELDIGGSSLRMRRLGAQSTDGPRRQTGWAWLTGSMTRSTSMSMFCLSARSSSERADSSILVGSLHSSSSPFFLSLSFSLSSLRCEHATHPQRLPQRRKAHAIAAPILLGHGGGARGGRGGCGGWGGDGGG